LYQDKKNSEENAEKAKKLRDGNPLVFKQKKGENTINAAKNNDIELTEKRNKVYK
jgi:hypothetical protein